MIAGSFALYLFQMNIKVFVGYTFEGEFRRNDLLVECVLYGVNMELDGVVVHVVLAFYSLVIVHVAD